MLLLIDEDVPHAVMEFFRERGHQVVHILDVAMESTPDPVVAAIGDDMGAILVTCNARHFKAIAPRIPVGSRARFRRLSLLLLKCRQSQALQRVTKHIEAIEFHYSQAQQQSDKRLIIEILNDKFNVHA